VAALLTELGYPDNSVDKVRDRLAGWERAHNTTVLVAEYQAHLVGLAAVAAIPYFEHGGNWGRIVALVVADGHRGRGIGRLLMEAAEKAALDQGCLTMEISSARHRAEAHAFYRTVGYEDWCLRSARFRKDLVPGASDYTMRGDSPELAGPDS
jgi:GNAT superfamily N-acetyltransferase